MSGGHLCEAEAPTEPAGETAARRAAIRSPVISNNSLFKKYRAMFNYSFNLKPCKLKNVVFIIICYAYNFSELNNIVHIEIFNF